jgi:hypothetical protein
MWDARRENFSRARSNNRPPWILKGIPIGLRRLSVRASMRHALGHLRASADAQAGASSREGVRAGFLLGTIETQILTLG